MSLLDSNLSSIVTCFSSTPTAKKIWNHNERHGNPHLCIENVFLHVKTSPISSLQKCIHWFQHNDSNFFLASQIFIPICQQQVPETSGGKVLFMRRYPIFTCLIAFLKDDASENKMQHLSLFG